MSTSSEEHDNPGPVVHLSDCRERHSVVDARVDKLELALFGKDGRGGMVQDISQIKSATGFLKSILVPIVTAALSAIITAGIIEWLTHFHV